VENLEVIGPLMRQVRRLVRAGGYDVVRYEPQSNYLALRKFLLDKYQIDVVLDVGANVGGFGRQIRDLGFTNRIVSFEPVRHVFQVLDQQASKDGNWAAMNYGLGDFDGSATINISENNAESSSILEMRECTVRAAPSARYVRQEDIQVKRLDTVFDSVCAQCGSVYLKIDTQGFEKQVLEGGLKSLQRVSTVQLELSLESLYENDTSFLDMCLYIQQKGFRAVSFEPGFLDLKRGQMLQVDGIFHRF